MPSRTVALLAALLTALLTAPSALAGAPPASRIEPVRDTYFGTEIVDNYRWLEGDNADEKRMGAMTDEVAAWTDAQNAYTRQVLDNLPGRKELEARLRPLMEVGSVGRPAMAGDRYFYSKREGSQNQPLVYMRSGPGGTGEPKLLLDPATVDPSGLVTISWTAPSDDGQLLAFGMYRAGDENSTLYIMNTDTGDWLADEIPGKVGGVSWMPDSSGFFYRRLADPTNPYSGQVKFHRLGTHHRQDKTLFTQSDPGAFWKTSSAYSEEEARKLATTYGPWAYADRAGKWLLFGYATGTRSNDLWVQSIPEWDRTGVFAPKRIVEGTLATGFSAGGPIVGDTLYMETTIDAPNGRIVAVDLNNPARDAWRELVPERKDATLESVSAAGGVIVATYLRSAHTVMERFDLSGRPMGELALPGIGSADLSTREDRTEAFFSYTSFNEPSGVYRVDVRENKPTLWERPAVPVDPSLVEVKQVWYSSKDGTKVSMFIVHRKGLKLDGDNPTVLNGYGGFNVSETPFFSPTLFTWFEDGGVFALPNLRGGGEYGEAWHKAGMLENKQNVFDDFISAAEWLIQNGYTSPRRLAITGGSNGGLLTGACLVQRPELFGAVVVGVPLLDMLRYQHFLMARYWVPEYGAATERAQFDYLVKYSPYHNIKPGTRYPAVLLTAGENDTRVHPLHARKMAAALQAATASDQNDKPVLLWVDREAGHGQGKPLNLRIRDAADTRIFLMWQLGMLRKQG
ncbi:MAG: prolyl oligopeptidase family serine peptidase [Phycisphaerales bacterium]